MASTLIRGMGCLLRIMLVFYCVFISISSVQASINDDPFILLSSPMPDRFFLVNLTDSTVNKIPIVSNGQNIQHISWDPIDEKVYILRLTSGGYEILKMNIDGSDSETFASKTIFDSTNYELYIDWVTRTLYTGRTWEGDNLRSQAFVSIPSYTYEQILWSVTGRDGYEQNILGVPGSRVFYVYKSDTETANFVEALDKEGGYCENEKYTEQLIIPTSFYKGIEDADVDLATGNMYTISRYATPTSWELHRRNYDDQFQDTSYELLYSTQETLADGTVDLEVYGQYAYICGNQLGLGRVALEFHSGAPDPVSGTPAACNSIYLHDPKEYNIIFALNNSASPMFMNVTRNATLDVTIDKAWGGGIIGHMVLPTNLVPVDELTNATVISWTIHLTFPRQVYDLKLEGCNAEVDEKQTVRFGRRTGTAYTLRSGPDYELPEPGQQQSIKFIGKTWRTLRGFKRPIELATFTSVYSVEVESEEEGEDLSNIRYPDDLCSD